MKSLIGKLSIILLSLLPSYVIAANTTYVYDTVTSIDLHSSQPRIIGLEKDTGNPLDISFVDNTNINYRFVVNRCVPVFLTAIEKPGRYYLYLTVDPAASSVQLTGCRLEVK